MGNKYNIKLVYIFEAKLSYNRNKKTTITRLYNNLG